MPCWYGEMPKMLPKPVISDLDLSKSPKKSSEEWPGASETPIASPLLRAEVGLPKEQVLQKIFGQKGPWVKIFGPQVNIQKGLKKESSAWDRPRKGTWSRETDPRHFPTSNLQQSWGAEVSKRERDYRKEWCVVDFCTRHACASVGRHFSECTNSTNQAGISTSHYFSLEIYSSQHFSLGISTSEYFSLEISSEKETNPKLTLFS